MDIYCLVIYVTEFCKKSFCWGATNTQFADTGKNSSLVNTFDLMMA
jgi:hypothetical protein